MPHCPDGHQDLVEANNAIKEAQLALMARIAEVYPMGREVDVLIGSRRLRVRINGYGASYLTSAGDLWGVNVESGRMRRFHFSQIINEQGD